MRIVIVGAGKLGYSIAKLLADEQHDVVVVEQNEERREIVKNTLDVLTIGANGASPLTMVDPDINGSDMLIAATASDEVNMVICILAKKNNIKHTVARIRDMRFVSEAKDFLKENMGIDLMINPEQITAWEINRILMTPSAFGVEEYADGKVRMVEMRIQKDSEWIGIPLSQLNLPKQMLIGMVFRNHQMMIPHGDDSLMEHDNVYFIGSATVIREFENKFTTRYSQVRRALIIGAGRAGRCLARLLDKQGVKVKIIDRNRERCRKISEKLEKGFAIYGDGTDIDLLTNEGIAEADVVVCITEDDKLNLLMALLAKHLGAKKTIVRVARTEYVDLMEKVGVDVVLSARLLSASKVLAFVRSGGIVSVSLLEGAKAEAIEMIVPEKCAVAGKKLMDVNLPKSCLVCAYVRNGEAYIPNGFSMLQPGDRAIIFLQTAASKKVMHYFESRA